MKFPSNLLSILIFILLGSLVAQEKNEEFRATWVITWEHISSSSLAETNKARVRTILGNHKTANMNAVLWQARQSGTAYYNSSYEPWGYYAGYQNPGYDPLEYAIEEAHKRGLELHAWFNVFQCSSTHEGTPAAEHPKWICRDGDGKPMTENICLSPGLDSVRAYLVDVAMEIVNNYDIDGLHLDYVRWNEYTKESSKFAKVVREQKLLDGMITSEQIEELQTADYPDRYLFDVEHPYSQGIPEGFDSWEEWWRWTVTEFVQVLHDSIQAVKPWVRLSVAALGRYNWYAGWDGYNTVFQDAALWFNGGYIEQLTPMHYHWLTGNEFYSILVGPGTQCWEPWIEDGINEGRIYSVGPGSYRFAENNVWNNHPGVISACRNVEWVDGFQFFSYGSWNGYQYWNEAGNTFFSQKTKIRDTQLIDNLPPEAPTLILNKVDSLNYEINITPTVIAKKTESGEKQWFAIYRSQDETIDVDTDEIINIHFGDTAFTVIDSFSGTQDFDEVYTYGATAFDRYWNESTVSNAAETDPIPSFAPIAIYTYPSEGDTVPVNTDIVFQFSKTMDTTTFSDGLIIEPPAEISKITWSDHWEAINKLVTVKVSGGLLYDTTYTVTLNESITDINGKPIDGNGDGVAGDPFILHFSTSDIDVIGPNVVFSYPDDEASNFDTDDVITVIFDELIDIETISENTVMLSSNGSNITTEPLITSYLNQSVLTFNPYSRLMSDATYTFTLLNTITDTIGNPMESDVSIQFYTANNYYSVIESIDDFSINNEAWWDPNQAQYFGIISSGVGFGYSTSIYLPSVSNKKSGYTNYQWDPNSTEGYLIREHCVSPVSDVHIDTSYTLQCYVYGDNSNNQFRFALYEKDQSGNNTSNTAEVSKWVNIDWVGWRLLEWDLGDTNSVGSWIGNGIMDGAYYVMEGFHLTHPEEGELKGRIYFDDLRVVKKSGGQAPPNSPPVIAAIPDTFTTEGYRVKIKVNYSDPDPTDEHQILAYSDTTAINFSILGHTPGSSIYIIPQSGYIGTANIEIIVKDFGVGELSDTASFKLEVRPGGATTDEKMATTYTLSQNYPNPFNSTTKIKFSVAKDGNVQLVVYDILGRKVFELLNEKLTAGFYEISFNASDLSSGAYIYQLITDEKVITRKMLLLK